jgi:hypothetical protein
MRCVTAHIERAPLRGAASSMPHLFRIRGLLAPSRRPFPLIAAQTASAGAADGLSKTPWFLAFCGCETSIPSGLRKNLKRQPRQQIRRDFSTPNGPENSAFSAFFPVDGV